MNLLRVKITYNTVLLYIHTNTHKFILYNQGDATCIILRKVIPVVRVKLIYVESSQ